MKVVCAKVAMHVAISDKAFRALQQAYAFGTVGF